MKLQSPLILSFLILLMSCSSDNDSGTNSSPTCQNPANTVFKEKDNLVLVEFEENIFHVEWKLEKNSSSTGQGYYVWTGNQSLGTPGNDLDFKWQASTSDNDAHNIYVEFDNPGTYTMQVSVRSSGHGIDKFLLYKEESYSFNEATTSSNFSEISCN